MTAPTLEDEAVEFPSLDAASVETDTPEDAPTTRTRRRRSDAGKTRGPRGSSTPRTPGTPRANKSQKQLELDLMLPMATLAKALSFTLPTVGAVILARGETTSRALVAYAQNHPKMLAALQAASNVGPAGEVIETIAMVIIAANLDLGKMDPANPVAQLTGVTAIYAEMHGYMQQPPPQSEDGDEEEAPPFGGFDNITPAPPAYIADGYNADGTFSAPPAFRAGESAQVRNNG